MQTKDFQDRLMALQTNLLNFAFTLTASRDDAYDLLQDTTLKALDNRDKYADGTNFKGWIFTIMRNIFINHYRRTMRGMVVSDESDDLFRITSAQAAGGSQPDHTYAVREINEAIGGFPEEYRVPFSLHVAGYKYAEIALRMGLPVGTVKSRIFYARKALQKILRDYRS